MRPTHLSIEGLTSFRTLQEIAFGDLDLFVITGPTGAGKSSILDAMTFALYGDVCRVKGGQLRDLISHGATHVKVSLEFRMNGSTYRVARRMKKVGQGHDVQFVRLEGGQEVPVSDAAGVKAVEKSIEQVLGLDFSAFTKAVLLPQGAFHEFLKGDASARRQILIRLLDLDRYLRVGAKARDQAKLLAARLDERQKLIESEYGDATPEALKAATKEEKTARKAYKELKLVESNAKEQISRAQAADAIAVQAADAEETFRQLEHDVAAYANELAPLDAEIETRKKATLEAAKVVTDSKKAHASAESALAKVIAKVGEEAEIARLKACADARTTEQATLLKLNEQLGDAAKVLAIAEAAHAAELDSAKKAMAAFGSAKKIAEKAKAALEFNTALLEHARAAAEENAARTTFDHAENARKSAIGEAEAARSHLQHLQQADLATTLRVGLKAGDICPVCETTIATLPRAERGAASLLKQAQRDVETADARRLESERACAAAKTTHASVRTRLANARAALPSTAKLAARDEAEPLHAAAESAWAEAEDKLRVANQAQADADTRIATADAKRRVDKARLKGIEDQVAAANARLVAAESELTSAFPAKLPADVEAVLTQRSRQVTEARLAVSNAATDLTSAQGTSSTAIASLHEAEGLLTGLAKRFAETRTKAEMSVEALERVASITLSPLPEARDELDAQVRAVMAGCPDFIKAASEVARAGVKSRDEAVRTLGVLLTPLELAPGGALEHGLEAVAAKREEAHTGVVRAETAGVLLKDKIGKRAELEQEIKDDTIRCARYKALGQELHQDRFVAFVLAESMARLAALASVELLRISGERYSLVAGDDGFDVVDHHNADEHRSVATLSGGETFLASLALALALAGSVRDLAGTAAAARLDAIFIDEGFGALDPETLEVVVDALERLGEGERMVGVISHVDALAERIPQGLLVTKSGGISTVAVR